MPFALVHATLGAVAAGELEEAFERLIGELRDWGVRSGALYIADDGQLHRLAGRPVDPTAARRLSLYDAYDAVGEIHLDLEGDVNVELLELLQDIFGLGLGRRVRTGQLDLVHAALDVNAAQSLDEALDVLADTCRRVAGATNASVTVWQPDLSKGVVRGAAGEAYSILGEAVEAGNNVPYRAVATRRPVFMAGDRSDGLGPRTKELVDRYECAIGVPLLVEGAPPITFGIAWRKEPARLAVDETIATVQKLAALTLVAFRAAEERARLEHEDLLRAVIEAVPDGIWIQHGEASTLNAAAREILDNRGDGFRQPDEYCVRRLDGSPAKPEEWPSNIAVRTGEPAHARFLVTIRDEDRVLDCKAAPLPEGFVRLIRDVTDEYSEQALTREFLERLFDSLPLGAVVADAETWTIENANPAFSELVGYAGDELLGMRPPFAWWDKSASLDNVALEQLQETIFRGKDGRPIPVEFLPFTVPGQAGSRTRLVVLARDTTERREFDRQLIQSGKLAAIGELASGVAHEINNPLFAILGLVEFLLRDAEDGTKAHERLLLIQQTGLEIKEIVKALLDFARERTDEYRPLSLRDAVADTVELLRRTSATKGVELIEDYASEPTVTVGSPNQIKQVLLNLIRNAQQVVPDGGTITVSVRPEEKWVVASVSDDGPGIPPHVLPRIFEPFFTTKRDSGGTGLGLAVSHGIAEMHGGALVAHSAPGEGATFELRLPRADDEEVIWPASS